MSNVTFLNSFCGIARQSLLADLELADVVSPAGQFVPICVCPPVCMGLLFVNGLCVYPSSSTSIVFFRLLKQMLPNKERERNECLFAEGSL